MFNKINIYIFFQILKSCSLLLFIFLAITWLLQLTRLFSLTNLIQIDVLNIIYLSLFLIPNLLSVIIPFILIFGILLCFVKLNRDKETIAIYTLGLQLNPIKYSLIIFSSIIIIFYILLNFFMAPIIYEKYKMKEFELRNTIDFNKIVTSNFLKLNKNTILDFKKNKNFFEDIYINYNDNGENIIFAKKGLILDENDQFIFKLENGFKLNFNENKEVEKLEFENYILKFENENVLEFNKFDRNTFTVFEDIQNKDYLNISYKLFDIIFSILIIIIFYNNNIIKIDYSLKNNLIFILLSVFVLILNQILKNSEVNFTIYLGSIFIIFIFCISFVIIRKKYV